VPPASRVHLAAWDRRAAERSAERARHLAKVEAALPAVREILRAYGVRDAYLFGSTVSGHARARPDVDLAVAGCPPERFFRLGAELERAFGLPLDLLDLEMGPASLSDEIRRGGRKLLP